MKQSSLELFIPAAKLEAVEKALHQAFNTTIVEGIILLNGGYSGALVYNNRGTLMNEILSRIIGWEA